jgi:enamine deaminase RidA (YjgF/YER057c/UK114 family)
MTIAEESGAMIDKLTFVQPEGFPIPKGYSNGVVTNGPTLFIAGQIGWNAERVFETDDLVEQFGKALDNVLAVVRAAGGGPGDIAKMTIYVTDLDAYRRSQREIGQVWRARIGKHFPAMALVGVAGLVEQRAKVEIETVAVLGRA